MQPELILSLYDLPGRVKSVQAYGNGHINDTFRVETESGEQFILQRLSPAAFREPEKVMQNVAGVTDWLRKAIALRGGDPGRETLRIIPLRDGGSCHMAPDGCWRMYGFIAGTKTWQHADSEELFRESGRAFGRFLRDLAEYPADTLHETIPHFHDTPDRLRQLQEAIAQDAAGRAEQVQAEIAFALERSFRAGELVNAGLPLRVTHNDTKLNNVLMDAETGKALCVVDLDTVMPGLCVCDFGDAVRFGANTAAEDEQDLTRVHFSLPMFRAYAEGYLGEAGDMLTAAEIRTLPLGAWTITYELGMRFLTDYLNGDTYFHTAYPQHNLVRARVQFALLADMEHQQADMQQVVQKWLKE